MSILPSHLSRQERRAALRQLERDNASASVTMKAVPPDQWPACMIGKIVMLFRSRQFLAQLYEEPNGVLRLSVNRSMTDKQGDRWIDGITWDQLQQVKAECGFGDQWAVEVYPPESDIVNVANVRHLWLLPQAPAFAWRKGE